MVDLNSEWKGLRGMISTRVPLYILCIIVRKKGQKNKKKTQNKI
jgi:hypothetical protein